MGRTYNPLLGAIEFQGVPYVYSSRAPTTSDRGQIPTVWVDSTTQNIYMAISQTGGITTWVLITDGEGSVLQFTTDDANTVNPIAGTVIVAGGTGLNTTGAVAGTVTINLDVPVTVDRGGSGAQTFTDGGILLGSGTSAFTATAQPINGQLLIGSNGADPVLATITAGTNVTVTNAAGSITINASTGAPIWSYTGTSTTPYTVLTTDFVIGMDSTGGAKQVNLPNAPTAGSAWIVKDVAGTAAGNNITVTTPGGVVLIDGAATYVINVAYGSATFVFNGTSYMVI